MSGEHGHPDIDAAIAALSARIDTEHADSDHWRAVFVAENGQLRDRIAALEAALAPVDPFTADRYVTSTGDDTADGLTRSTAWRTLSRAFATNGVPAGLTLGAFGEGIIAGGALYDRGIRIMTPRDELVQVQGPGRYSLRLQRAHGTVIPPGADGMFRVLPPLTIVEPPAADGTDAGTIRQSAVEITDCNDLNVTLDVVAGTDFGVLVQGTSLRNRIAGYVTDAGHGFHLKGNLGMGVDRTWIEAAAVDCHRMIRNTAQGGDDYGAVGFVFENSTGGGLRVPYARRCFAPSRDYVADGGGIELYDATDAAIDGGSIRDCEGGIETGGSSGKGCKRITITGLRLEGDLGAGTGALGQPARSPGFLLRNLADSTVEFTADVTRAKDVLRVEAPGNGFAGSMSGTTITGTIQSRPGVNPIAQPNPLPAGLTLNVAVLP